MSKIQRQTTDSKRGFFLISASICDISNLTSVDEWGGGKDPHDKAIRSSNLSTGMFFTSEGLVAWGEKQSYRLCYFPFSAMNTSCLLRSGWRQPIWDVKTPVFPISKNMSRSFKLIKILCHYEFLRKHRSQWPHIQCDMKAEAERSKCPYTILVVDLVYKTIEFQIVMPLSAKETMFLSLSYVSERSVSLKL